jgi:hypothetical protein
MWWLNGSKGGRVRAEILLSPELPPKIQTFALTSVPEPSSLLRDFASRIVAAMAPRESPVAVDWPEALSISADVDLDAIRRAMRAAEARFGPVRLGSVIDGDGERKATFRLVGDRGELDLELAVDPDARCVDAVSLVPVRQVPPDYS